MPPFPNPTEDQVELVREIAQLASYSEALERINTLTNFQWGRALMQLEQWETFRHKHVQVRGRADVNYQRQRDLHIREMRLRLGLDPNPGSDFAAHSGPTSTQVRYG